MNHCFRAKPLLKILFAGLAFFVSYTAVGQSAGTEVPEFQPLLLDQSKSLNERYTKDVDPDAVFFKIDPEELRRLYVKRPKKIRFMLPGENGKNKILLLERRTVTAPGFRVRSGSKDNPVTEVHKPGAHYRGQITGTKGRAAVSFFEDWMMGVLMEEDGNTYNLGEIDEKEVPRPYRSYTLVNDKNINANIPFNCGNLEEHVIKAQSLKVSDENAKVTKSCRYVGIYFEADRKMYNDFGASVVNTENYIEGFFNVVAELYEREQINIVISDIFVWTTADPYLASGSTGGILGIFRNEMDNRGFVGDLAHFVSTRSIGGGVAYVNVLCLSPFWREYSTAVSRVYTTYNNLPAYSWTILVVAHELGHNFGSRHTQNCRWPGGPIDDCYAVEDSTGAANNGRPGCQKGPNPSPPFKGTIMSYCHLVGGIGINPMLGFGPLPGNVIRDRYNSVTCLNNFTIEADITSPASPHALCPGDNVTLTAASCAECEYQWERNNSAIPGETNLAYNTNQTGSYTMFVKRLACELRSPPVLVVEEPAPCGQTPNGAVAGGGEYCDGDTPGNLTLSGHTGTVVRWEYSTDHFATSTNVANTTVTFDPNTLSLAVGTTCFRAVIDNGGSLEYSTPDCITIYPLPNVQINLPNTLLCQGENLYLGATGADTYVWYNIDGSVIPGQNPRGSVTGAGEISVVGTDVNGCEAADTFQLELSPGAEGIELVSTGACQGDLAILQAYGLVNGTAYQWEVQPGCSGPWSNATGPGANGPIYTTNPLALGSTCYRLTLSDPASPCVDWESDELEVVACGDIEFDCANLTYSQDFNNINPSNLTVNSCASGNVMGWQNDYTIGGWHVARLSGSGTFTRLVTNGMSSPTAICGAQGIMFLGDDGSAERALGSWSSGGVQATFGGKFVNNTGRPITQIDVDYVLEQWTRGSTVNGVDRLVFEYSENATAVDDGSATWTVVPALNGNSPTTTPTGSLDGNNPVNQANVTGSITGLSIPDGAMFWLRWTDADLAPTQYDHLGIDDLSVSVVAPLPPAAGVTPPANHCESLTGTYEVTPVAGVGTVTYDWTIPAGCAGWSLASPNGTTSTLMDIIAGPADCNNIEVVASDDCGPGQALLFDALINCPSDGGTLNADATVCEGVNSTVLTVTGYSGAIIRWESSTDNFASQVSTINHTTDVYTTPNLALTTCYRAIVQAAGWPEDESTVACVTVETASDVGTLSANSQNICLGDPATLQIAGYNGATIRWSEQPGCVGAFNSLPAGDDLATFDVTPGITGQTCYRVEVQNTAVCAFDAEDITIEAYAPPVSGSVNVSTTPICEGDATDLTLTGFTGSGISWEEDPGCSGTFVAAPALGTSAAVTITPTATTCYRAVVSASAFCPSATTAAVTVDVVPQPFVNGLSTSATVCEGGTRALSVASSSGTLEWEEDPGCAGAFTPIAGSVNQNPFNVSPAGLTCYRVSASNAICGAVYSQTTAVEVDPLPSVGAASADQTICPGDFLTLDVSSFSGNISWEEDPGCAGSFVLSPGSVGLASFNVAPATTTCYRAAVGSGVCATEYSTPVTITVDPAACPACDSLTFAWARDEQSLTITDMATDPSGNALVTGWFNGNIAPGGISLSSQSENVFVAKYAPDGTVLWAAQGGDPAANDRGASIAVDGTGAAYVTGWFSGAATFGTTTITSMAAEDVFVVKYDAAGNVVWAKSAGGFAHDRGYGIASDAAGNTVVTGWFQSRQATFGANVLNAVGQQDIFVAKYDASGNEIWAQRAGGTSLDMGYDVAIDATGAAYVTGWFQSPAGDFGGIVLNNGGGKDVFLSKYDATGGAIWAEREGGPGDDQGWSLALDAGGNPHLSGRFSSFATFGATNLTATSVSDVFVAKYDAAGASQWATRAGGININENNSIAVGTGGSVYVATDYYGGLLPGGGTLVPAGASDLLLTEFDATGAFQRLYHYGTPGEDRGLALAADANGRLWTAGYYGFGQGGSLVLDNITLTNHRGRSGFIGRMGCSPACDLVAGMISGATTVCPESNSGTLTLSGNNAAVVQWERSTDGQITWTPINETSSEYEFENLGRSTHFRVKVGAEGCEDVWSAPVTVFVGPEACQCDVPENPAVLDVTSSNGVVTWDAVPGAVSYTVSYRRLDQPGAWNTVSITNNVVVLNGLDPTTEYVVRIQSHCAQGLRSNASAPVRFTTEPQPAPCAVPDGLRVVAEMNTSAILTWNAVPGASSYVVRYRQDDNPSSWVNLAVMNNVAVINGLNSSKWHLFRVRARCGGGNNSTYSPVEYFQTTPQITTCDPATGITFANTTNTSVDLSWNAVSGATSYLLLYRPVGSTNWNRERVFGVTSYTLTGLMPGTTYQFRMKTLCGPNRSNNTALQTFATNFGIRAGAEETAYGNLSVYPNPNNGSFVVAFDAQEAGRAQVALFDARGAKVWQESRDLSAGANTLRVNAELPGGLYLLELSADGQKQVVKLVVE